MLEHDLWRCIRNNRQGCWKSRSYTSDPPCLLSDNGPCYIASSLKEYLGKVYNIKHIHGKPLHPQTQAKIERYHRSMKNVIKLNHYFCPSELEKAIDEWVKYYREVLKISSFILWLACLLIFLAVRQVSRLWPFSFSSFYPLIWFMFLGPGIVIPWQR